MGTRYRVIARLLLTVVKVCYYVSFFHKYLESSNKRTPLFYFILFYRNVYYTNYLLKLSLQLVQVFG